MSSYDAKTDTLRHMLGITDFSTPLPADFYRDYFCASKGDAHLAEMEADGLVRCYNRDEHYDWYTTTEAGKRAAIASFKVRMYPKAKRRYHAWLRLSDTAPDLTFREYLTNPAYAEHRSSL
jgi:hypothetical protein